MIITNEDLLRVNCIDLLPEEVGTLVETLELELKQAKGGVGLAAPQIGIAKNIAIIRAGNFGINLVNAKIIKQFDSFIHYKEGCLSFPGRVEDVPRFQEIVVSNFISPKDFVAKGILAVIVQHELDHLNNVLFIDRAIKKVQKKVKPNDPCICGKINPITNEIKKYKNCCYKG
jgi:peptide deformylase